MKYKKARYHRKYFMYSLERAPTAKQPHFLYKMNWRVKFMCSSSASRQDFVYSNEKSSFCFCDCTLIVSTMMALFCGITRNYIII